MSVDAVVYYRVSNATVSVANVENAHHSTRLLAQTTLRNILGTKDLHEILGDRETISGSMQAVCDLRFISTIFVSFAMTVERLRRKLYSQFVFHLSYAFPTAINSPVKNAIYNHPKLLHYVIF